MKKTGLIASTIILIVVNAVAVAAPSIDIRDVWKACCSAADLHLDHEHNRECRGDACVAHRDTSTVDRARHASPLRNPRDLWQEQSGGFAAATQPGAGFSFKYGGNTIGPIFSSDWRRTVGDGTQADLTSITWTHESGLAVTRETRVMPSFGAVEYKLRFKNTAGKPLPSISALQALNLSFTGTITDENCVISSGGGLADKFLPPRTFAIRKHCFAPTVPSKGLVDLTTEGGRSSNKDLPFFFIQNETQRQGLFVAFGWSGQWGAMVQRSPAGMLNVRGRVPGVEVALAPGEEIQGPTVVVGLYKGEAADGSNRLRRLIRDVYTPQLAGKRFLPVATYDTYYGVGTQFDEALLKKLAEGAAAVGQEYFLLDAGWFKGKNWFTSVGNWEQVERSRLPNGLKPIADHVRSQGLKFGLWFEPERVAEGSQLAIEHPEWVLWDYGNAAAPWFGHVPWISDLNEDRDAEFFNKRFGLLDYGRPEVQQWVKNLLERYIRDDGVKYIRYDFNVDPLPYWDANDKPNRRGMTQLRHIQGFYSVIDWIRKRHPDVVLEGCASGGRRIDFETVRRFHTFWISDYSADPAMIRFHLFGINHFLPGNYHYIQYTQSSPDQKDFKLDDLGFQSLFGGAFGISGSGRLDLWPEQTKQQARLHVETWKKLRRYLLEDYYPLSAQPGDVESWSGWQFQDPKDESGFVQTFRTKTPDAAHRFVIHKLDERARYRFTDAYGAQTFDIAGSTAMKEGIEVTQEPMSSKVFTYRKISE